MFTDLSDNFSFFSDQDAFLLPSGIGSAESPSSPRLHSINPKDPIRLPQTKRLLSKEKRKGHVLSAV